MKWFEMRFSAVGWEEDELFWEDAQEADGKTIVKMTLATPGYWDLEFEDGTKIDAVHTVHIIPKL